MDIFNVITLAGGLAMFLYGMNSMGSGLEKLAGGKLESILQKLTSNIFKGVLLGAVITALIQSSSATTVIVIGLVNSGIMKFGQAIGIIMGANIGTTITSQILRLSDISGDNIFLQLVKPSSFAPALAFVGVILYVFFASSPKKRNIGQILLGFGILFIGMMTMEEAVYPLRESVWFAELFGSLQNPVLGILAGALVTAVIQSSSASVGILQALSSTGAVTWGNAIPIILGQNIGTCATGLISSVGASRSAKRVAMAHLYFNVIGTGLFVVVIYALKAILQPVFWDNPITRGGIADFHTLFNVSVTLVFVPFNKFLVWLAEKTVPEKEGGDYPELKVTVLDTRLYNSPSVAIAQAHKAVEQMATVSRINQKNALDILLHYNEEKIQLADQRESVVDKLDVSVSNYLVNMNNLDLSEEESRDVTILLNFVTEFERIGDYAINIVERSGEVHDKQVEFSDQALHEMQILHEAVGEVFDLTIDAFVNNNLVGAAKVEPLEETVDLICESLRDRHIKRLKKGLCNIDAGIIFLEVLTDYERISDHCSNVAARMLSSAESDVFDPHALRRSLHEGNLQDYLIQMEHYKDKYLKKLDDSAGEQLSFETASPVKG